MNEDIGKIVSECLNNPLINHYYMKKKGMTITEKKLREANFSKMIGYCILFRETDGIVEYMSLTDNKEQIKFLKDRIATKLGIPHEEKESRIVDIIDYAFDNIIKNGYVFHAGNSKAVEMNMEHGFSPSQIKVDEQMELMRIASIFKKYGNDNPLGWGVLDIEAGQNGWFYDSTPENMLYYADSPEWFGQFCGGNQCYAWNLIPEESRYGYANRDYDTCFLAISKLIERNNMSEEDKKEVIDFFNRCWSKFGDTNPSLVFIPISSLSNGRDLENIRETYYPSYSTYSDGDSIFRSIIEGGDNILGKNICCSDTVAAEGLSCVDLSPILPRFINNEDLKQRELTIQDCIKKLNNLDMEYLLKVQEMLDQFPTIDSGRGL